MEFLVIGLVSAFNMLIIKFKFDKQRYEDAIFDTLLMILLAYLFSGTYSGMVVAMVASLVISIIFFLSPPRFTGTWIQFLKSQWKEFDAEFSDKKPKKPTKRYFDL